MSKKTQKKSKVEQTEDESKKSKIDKLLDNCLNEPTHEQVADLFLSLSDISLYCHSLKHYISFYFDEKSTLYKEIEVNELSGIVRETLSPFIVKEMFNRLEKLKKEKSGKEMSDEEEKEYNKKKKLIEKQFKSLKMYVESVPFSNNVSKCVMTRCKGDDFISEKADSARDVVCFRNGNVNLRTGEFKKRTKDDYFTVCLDYDYSSKRYPKIEKYIIEQFKHIWNDDEALFQENIKWAAYTLTGETYMKKAMFNIGFSANNAKSTFNDIFEKCFSIYYSKLKNETFNKGYQKAHKNFYNVKKPVRRVVIEELDQLKLDTSALKEFIDGRSMMNEELFKVMIKYNIYAKLNLNSNKYPKFDVDEGMKTRFFLTEYKNQFLDKSEYKIQKDSGEKGVYLKNNRMLEQFDDVKYKLSVFHVLLDYTKQIYQKDLSDEEFPVTRQAYLKLIELNDTFNIFVNENYVITKNMDDRVGKDEFLDLYRKVTNLNCTSIRSLITDIKRLGLVYDPNLRELNSGRNGKKGVIKGLRRLTEEEQEEKQGKSNNVIRENLFIDDGDDMEIIYESENEQNDELKWQKRLNELQKQELEKSKDLINKLKLQLEDANKQIKLLNSEIKKLKSEVTKKKEVKKEDEEDEDYDVKIKADKEIDFTKKEETKKEKSKKSSSKRNSQLLLTSPVKNKTEFNVTEDEKKNIFKAIKILKSVQS
jgi:hypothetical protein